MPRAYALAAAVAVALTAPSGPALACAEAIDAIDRQLRGAAQDDAWIRTQVRLYIAEQMLDEGHVDGCLAALREAHEISGIPVSGTLPGGPSGAAPPTTGTDAAEDAGPAGANVIGVDPEGWGNDEGAGGSTGQ